MGLAKYLGSIILVGYVSWAEPSRPRGICRLQNSSMPGTSTCSGFFIDNETFISADHCIRRGSEKLHIICNNGLIIRMDSEGTTRGNPVYASSGIMMDGSDDFMIAKIPKTLRSQVKPYIKNLILKFPASCEESDKLVARGKCYLLGGSGSLLLSKKDGNWPVLSSSNKLQLGRVQRLEPDGRPNSAARALTFQVSALNRIGLKAPPVAKGDSGGPIVCWSSEANEYRVVGIASTQAPPELSNLFSVKINAAPVCRFTKRLWKISQQIEERQARDPYPGTNTVEFGDTNLH